MVLYTAFAKPKQGLNQERLGSVLEILMNFKSPLLNEIFMLFDQDTDDHVWFDDFIRGLDIIERGNFE